MIENELDSNTSSEQSQKEGCFEMTYGQNKYRFVPKSNYWICIESNNWSERWVICSDEFGLTLSEEAQNRGVDIDQMLSDNKCPKRRRRIQKKKSASNEESTFLSLFDSEENEEDSGDDFISLF